MKTILALDLEGTLISNAVSQIPRPGLKEFLEQVNKMFSRVVMFTSVPEDRFRSIAKLLVDENCAPFWFTDMEYIVWSGKTKNLEYVPNSVFNQILLVDDYKGYIEESQIENWVPIECFEHPYAETDRELEGVLDVLLNKIYNK